MKIKSYFANTLEAAIRQAREELGSEAMLIESRTPSAEMRRLGRLEVVIGIPDNIREQPKSVLPPPPPQSGREDLAAELKMLRGQINDLRKMMQPCPVAPEIEDAKKELIGMDMDPAIVDALVQDAEVIWQDRVASYPGARMQCLQDIVKDAIRNRVQCVPEINCATIRGNVSVFVGPPGAGKTTALVKLAVQQCLAKRRSVRMISVDPDRVGGHELLRAYSNFLGIGFAAANSFSDLQDALDQSQEKMCVLIDTPGYGASDMDAAHDLATVLERVKKREVHLVLPASMKRADVTEYADRYTMFKPSRLLFTKLDETASAGSILSEALRLGLPLSFFTTGQSVPEDIENGDCEMLIRRLFPANLTAAANAA